MLPLQSLGKKQLQCASQLKLGDVSTTGKINYPMEDPISLY